MGGQESARRVLICPSGALAALANAYCLRTFASPNGAFAVYDPISRIR